MFKIMIVEDDARIKEILLENVVRWGFEGKAVENFNDVFVEFSKYSPHLILMDINLPFLMDFTGVIKSEKYQKFQLYLFLQEIIIWM